MTRVAVILCTLWLIWIALTLRNAREVEHNQVTGRWAK